MAAPVTGWQFDEYGATNLPCGAFETASPWVGDGSSKSAESNEIWAAFAPIELTMQGDSIILTGQVAMADLSDDAGDEFRFGLYDSRGNSGVVGWFGYFASMGGQGAKSPKNGLLRKRDKPGGGFPRQANTTRLADCKPPEHPIPGGTVNFMFSIERTADGKARLVVTLSGDRQERWQQRMEATDASPPSFRFDRVGILHGWRLGASRMAYRNMDVRPPSAGGAPDAAPANRYLMDF